MSNIEGNLIGSRWKLVKSHPDLEDSEIEFCENGILIDGSHQQKWSIVEGNIILSYTNGYAIYTGTINNNKITGTAKNRIGIRWTFKAEKIINGHKLIGTRWLLKSSDYTIEDSVIEFCENGILLDDSCDEEQKWCINNDNIILSFYGFSKYTGTISYNEFSGKAENNNGQRWTFKAVRIIEEENIVPKQYKITDTENVLTEMHKGEFTYYYYYKYYPQRFNVSEELSKVRQKIWDFKDGKNSREIAKSFTKYLKFDIHLFSNWWLCIVPASTKAKTELRYKLFCEEFCKQSKIYNGYSLIVNKFDREAVHLQKERASVDILDCIDFGNVRGKDILLFDDIYTTGKSFLKIASRLKSLGANEVIGMFLGKTHWLDEDNS